MPDSAKRRHFVLPRGGELAALQWESHSGASAAPVALLHHANGFCAATWALVAERLRERYRVVALDARGHGRSFRPEGDGAYDWHRFVDDVETVAQALADESGAPVRLGAGNSFGGTVTACAAARRPGLFERVVMLDPVLRPPEALAERLGLAARFPGAANGVNPMVELARKRRAVWPSRRAARESWADKEMFRSWAPRALDLYVEHGLRERDDGQVELCCPPEVEAAVFAMSSSLDPFVECTGLQTPTLVVAAERGVFPVEVFHELARRLAKGRALVVDAGHLMPMEEPERAAELLLGFGNGTLP